MSSPQEILDRAVGSRSEAQHMIRRAVKHFREARRATIQVMADLRKLQDGGVHLLYGEKNFAVWAEQTFDGLAAGNVRQLTRAGGVALELERRGYIDLDKPEGIGTTGLRELSVVANEYGDDKMAEVFITARGMRDDGKEIAGTTIKAAMQLLMPPPDTEIIGGTPDAHLDDDDDDREPVPRSELEERVNHIQDLLWDVGTGADHEAMSTYREAMDEMVRLGRELKGEPATDDDKWTEGRR